MFKFCLLTLALVCLIADAAPHRRRWNNNRRRSSYHGRQGPNQDLKAHGKTKTLIGAGLLGAGLLSGDQNLQNTGKALVKLGLGSKLLAHFV